MMNTEEIRDLILTTSEKELQPNFFVTYFTDNIMLDLLVNAIINKKCISIFGCKNNNYETFKGVPKIEKGKIIFKYDLPLIEIFLKNYAVLEVKSGDKNVPHFSLIKNTHYESNLKIILERFKKTDIDTQLTEILAGLANSNKKATFFVSDTYYNTIKYVAKVYSCRIDNEPVLLFHPFEVNNKTVDYYYYPKPDIQFIGLMSRIVQINRNDKVIYKTQSFSEEECNRLNTKYKMRLFNYYKAINENY